MCPIQNSDMKNRLLTFLLFLSSSVFGQTISYLENTILYSNPAARVQSKFFSTNTLNVDLNLKYLNFNQLIFRGYSYNKVQVKNFQFGLGMTTILAKGFRSGTLFADANYKIDLGEKLNLSVGVGTNVNQYGYYNFSQNDEVSNIFAGLKAGLMLEGRKWRAGLSFQNLNEPRLYIFDDTLKMKFSKGLYAEYRFRINENWGITPQINFNSISLMSNIIGVSAYYKKLQFGTSLVQSSASFFVGYTFNEKFMMSAISYVSKYLLADKFSYNHTSLNFSFAIPSSTERKKVVD